MRSRLVRLLLRKIPARSATFVSMSMACWCTVHARTYTQPHPQASTIIILTVLLRDTIPSTLLDACEAYDECEVSDLYGSVHFRNDLAKITYMQRTKSRTSAHAYEKGIHTART